MKKLKILFLILVITLVSLSISLCVSAAPLNGLEQVVTQPDGTEITLYFYGDEIYSYMTDSNGSVVIQNPDNEYYVYATLNNGNIETTDYVVGDGNTGGAGGGTTSYITADNIPQSEFVSAYENSRFYRDPNAPEIMSLDYEDKDFNGMDINNIVVFIRFNDTNFTQRTKSFYDNLFNSSATSVKNYYDETTYGKLGVSSTFYPTTSSSTILTYRDTHNASYYKSSNYGYDWEEQQQREQTLFKNALEYVKDQIPDELDLDKNNDGYVDMITFVLPGLIQPGTNQVCWPHQWSFISDYATTINGLVTDSYNVQIEGALRGQKASNGDYTFQTASAIITHETHHILGFPDMYYYNYDYPTNKVPLGKWDIMCESDGAHTSDYMKNRYGGWLDIPEIKEEGTY